MARWSNSALQKLSGTDRNVIIDELVYGESRYFDVTFTIPTNVRVLSTDTSTNSITVLGDTSIFAVDDMINVSCDVTLLKIVSITDQVIVLDGAPEYDYNGYINLPVDLTDCTSHFELGVRKAVIADGRQGLDIESIETLENVAPIVGTVITNVSGMSLQNGQVRLSLSSEQLSAIEPLPELEDNESILLTGYFSYVEPAIGSTPAQTRKQRISIRLLTDGVVI